jgi:fumarate hydratase class I
MEALETDPAAFLRSRGGEAARLVADFEEKKKARSAVGASLGAAPMATAKASAAGGRAIDLDKPMDDIRAQLGRCAVGDRVLLSGKLIVGRDAAHQKWHELIEAGKSLPAYLAEHPIYYAGPADTPEGKTIGSFGPTTAQRMDAYADELMSRGASLVTLAKGNRASSWTAACKKYGGFYLGTVGGAAALIAEENIVESVTIDYPELGMEAVRLIKVVDLIAFVISDDKGNDLYARIASA